MSGSAAATAAWDEATLARYRADGFVLVRGLLAPAEVAALTAELPALLGGDDDVDGMHRERERTGAVRQVYLAHRHCAPYRDLARDPRLVGPARQVAGGDVYLWHSKLNVKDAFEGAVWLWHQDFGYWTNDGVQARFLSAMVLLDRATAHNGSLLVVAGSHRWGLLAHHADEVTTSYKQWCIDTPVLRDRLREEMIRPIIGEPGDVLFFDPLLVHGSGHNLSPLPRKALILCYNALANVPRGVEKPRPDWVVSRDHTPVR
ncbi:MAG TPA: phytanoyl-CoA dioxygenase family protein [Planctomycetota bacterium]|nr:phytanoyl-CoA dioxygenase family protein [Planctomycetota bacterium]